MESDAADAMDNHMVITASGWAEEASAHRPTISNKQLLADGMHTHLPAVSSKWAQHLSIDRLMHFLSPNIYVVDVLADRLFNTATKPPAIPTYLLMVYRCNQSLVKLY